MGQIESAEAAAETQTTITTRDTSKPTSLESALAEAAEYGSQHTESVEAMAQKALECPCISDLRTGSCGSQFSEAFLCFLKSTSEEKGSDCVHPFIALQSCIKANPDAFSKDILGEEESNELGPVVKYEILPPRWAKESGRPKSNL
ncbi:mitochondrial intermembrane space import and assembly protein 40 homolog [Vigna unguiculata]|uniref:mitochondrial intermembrane space import and assembly protein 40 homolog n=1 Tax=Vigna unguiculata TaxID=3917 RepID=UPI001015E6BA|nr:mitochondrial intermembrane space import and assembly protein 40 homolog [Vigna unguiculata]